MSLVAEERPNYLLGALAGAGILGVGFIGASMAGSALSGASTFGAHSLWSPIQRERIHKTFIAFGVGIAATAATTVLLFRAVSGRGRKK